MPYVPGPIPRNYEAGFFARELRRIGETYNVQDALGIISKGILNAPAGQTFVLAQADKVNVYDIFGPNPAVGDGPVNMDPRLGPDFDLLIQLDGIYSVTWSAAFGHDLGAQVGFELYFDDVGLGVGAVLDASQQTAASSLSFTYLLSVDSGARIDVRGQAVGGDELLDFTSVQFAAFKIRDLRTRFS